MWGAKVNLINWIRQPALMWSFSTKKVGLARDLFYAPSREHAKASILYHMDMMFGDDLEELAWEYDEEINADALIDISRDSDGQVIDTDNFGYLKLVNAKIKTIEEVMDNYVELTEEEKQRKKERMEEFKRRYERMTDKSKDDPEDYYAYNPPSRNPFFIPDRNYPTFGENPFEE